MRPGSDSHAARRRSADGRFLPYIRETEPLTERSKSSENASRLARLAEEDYSAMVEASRAKKAADDVEAAEAAATRIEWFCVRKR